MGGGGLDAIGHAIGSNDTLQEKADLLYKQSLDQVNNRVLQENDLDCIMSNGFAKDVFGHSIEGIPSRMKTGVKLNNDQFKDMVNSMLDDINHGQEKEVYFYHSDLCKSREQSQAGLSYAETQQSVRSKHLGSASWITDFGGEAVQHIQYLPYGEPYINQRLSSYNERFTFTGKELDEETGYGYFGARYMDHELMTMWLSIDPMADKYPGISPYAYCAWNPVKLVDPNGEEISTHTDKDGNVVMVYNDGDNGVYRHNGDREFTERELKSQYSPSNTSARGEYMGKTKYWDEFMNHDNNNTGNATKPARKIHYSESWEPVVVSYNELSMKLGLEATAIGSLPKGIFDIKSHKNIAPDGAMTGKLLEGYYTSARSAGNFLAGLNGATARGMFGQHISYDTYISLAGLLHMQNNKTSRQNEYKGEIPYSGRRIKEGFELGVKIREGRL